MKRYQDPNKTFVFVFIAALLMIATDFVFFPAKIVHEGGTQEAPSEKIFEHSEIEDFESGQAAPAQEKEAWQPGSLAVDIPQPEPIENQAGSLAKIIRQPAGIKLEKVIVKPVPRPAVKGNGLVAIIIDDMGMDRKRSRQAMELPAPLTLAFLPYAPGLPEITKEARDKGHELLIHVPMQPVNIRLDPGPLVLRDDMSAEGFDMALEKIFGSFEGYVGINNHMGSKLTQDREAMDRLMGALARRNLLFVDSVTISTSIAAQAAADRGLAYNARDIFLDHKDNKDYVMNALYELEVVAKKRGYAIAIGHPKTATIESLKEWLPTLKERGLTLVPVSRLARKAAPPLMTSVAYPEEPFGPARSQAPQP